MSDSYSTPLNLPLVRGGAVGGGVHPYQPFREIVLVYFYNEKYFSYKKISSSVVVVPEGRLWQALAFLETF
ncbi:hypothetical protein QUB80_26090 [Chlorogloeopsis sp. ULAP01]|uniref:hypothetical protein n=1 Tax=Chlorogloeopsis sp. ULAP01 TaxID=3056483 RepID=UPI0025AA567D|nr:hypothetical protein [Chlorogloeopsis sp. ULAP01]MDM9384151.1 hypothetical protein [Chlorogloeopsis sp. ULAP01]